MLHKILGFLILPIQLLGMAIIVIAGLYIVCIVFFIFACSILATRIYLLFK